MIPACALAARSDRLAIAVCVALGLALRLILLVDSGWRYDYDEHGWAAGPSAARARLPSANPTRRAGIVRRHRCLTLRAERHHAEAGVRCSRAVHRRLADRVASVQQPRRRLQRAANAGPLYLLVVGTKTWGATAETLAYGNRPGHRDGRTGGRCSARERALVALGLVSGIAFGCRG